MLRKSGSVTAILLIAAAAALAQADPPSRVARLNYIGGPVSFRPASVEDWTAATLNYPLTTGDHLWTDAGAQTEMHVGSTAIRMGSQTALSILNLDDRIVQLSLTAGSLNVHIRYQGDQETYEVDTPNVAISLLRPGDYRINADGDNNVTVATVRGGEAEVTAGGTAFTIHPMQTAQLSGVESVSQDIGPALPPDGFDRWCETRERREASSVSARYVPREMIGYEDLDAYGAWSEVPPYGWVWRPTQVVVGWAPYHYGHWAWVEPWGWTWIDDAPWGFAPFHYGRWAFSAGLWVWVPGRMVVGVRPVYAPALVAFVGGPRFGVSVSIGGGGGVAAWFPLGPGEVYRPAYHVSEVYVRQVNIVHVTDVTVINNVNVTNVRYVNQNVVGAVAVVPHEAFVTARPVHEVAMRVDAREIAGAQVIGTTAAVAPRRESIVAGPVRTNVPPRFAERQVVVRSAPPPPPVSFAAKQEALRNNGGRPLDTTTMNNLRTNNPPPRQPAYRNAVPAEPRYVPPRNDRPVSARPVESRPVQQVTPPATRNETMPVRKVEEPKPVQQTPVYQPPPATRNETMPARKVEETHKVEETKPVQPPPVYHPVQPPQPTPRTEAVSPRQVEENKQAPRTEKNQKEPTKKQVEKKDEKKG
ncbi:MAG TPA: DUF6600 domain-containing protein [Bryobacteraceae bacterium]|nr:DUF6600 domain-containing protein [Bryobacteraceae bacterium]